MEGIEDEQDDTDGDYNSQDDGISSLTYVYSLYQAVYYWKAIWMNDQGSNTQECKPTTKYL